MQAKVVFKSAVQRFKQAAIPEPELEVSILLAHVLQMERSALLLAGELILTDDQLAAFEEKAAKRLIREPLAYIIGEKEFWSLPFKVSPQVLIPRSETEFLLEKVLAILEAAGFLKNQQYKILDLGAGSGVIAVIMALELRAAQIIAVDRSLEALKVARFNAEKHQVKERIHFINSDWFGGLQQGAMIDVAIANPPYIAAEILSRAPDMGYGALQPEVVNFEPRLALDGGEKGLSQIKRLALDLKKYLKSDGWFFMEIGADQKKEVLDIFSRTASFDNLEVIHDYAGLPRVLKARKKRDK